jgi:hypothetical protein
VTGTFEWIWFWRESTKDALYSFQNVQLRPANLSNARYVGSQPNLEIRWAISEHYLAALNLAGSITGTFLQQSPPSKQIVFVNIGLLIGFDVIGGVRSRSAIMNAGHGPPCGRFEWHF